MLIKVSHLNYLVHLTFDLTVTELTIVLTFCPQSSQQIQDLQNVARHQSLLVENHQALLLQTSRMATHLQDMNKKPPAVENTAPGH